MRRKIIKILGAKSNVSCREIVFFDEAGNFCDEAYADRCLIREWDKRGNILREVWGRIEKD